MIADCPDGDLILFCRRTDQCPYGVVVYLIFKKILSGDRCKTSVRSMFTAANSSPVKEQMICENEVQKVELLQGDDDLYGGVVVKMTDFMDSRTFDYILRASISNWKHQVLPTS